MTRTRTIILVWAVFLLTLSAIAVAVTANAVDHQANGPTVVIGTSGPDKLVGALGPDTLVGKAGDDRLWGGRGPDKFLCGPGFDVVHNAFDTGHDTLRGCEKVVTTR